MRDWTSLKKRYLRDELPIRLGNLASNLARIKSFSRDLVNCNTVAEQAKLWSDRVLEMSGLLSDEVERDRFLFSQITSTLSPVPRAIAPE